MDNYDDNFVGNTTFTVCDTIVSNLNLNCGNVCTGSGDLAGTASFKKCLDGLVLAPWVTISFLSSASTGCTDDTGNQLNCTPNSSTPVASDKLFCLWFISLHWQCIA